MNKPAPRLGIVRVITSIDRPFLEQHARMISSYLSGIRLDIRTDCIKGFPSGVHTLSDEIRAVPHVVETGKLLVKDFKADSLIVSCAADPGVSELQTEVSVPVIGAGSASATLARLLERPTGVLGIEESAPRVVHQILGNRMVGYAKPDDVESTLDISRAIDDYRRLARLLVNERGAEVILLACTGLSTAGIAPMIEQDLGVKAVDPVIAAGITAYWAARLNQNRERSVQ